MDNHELIPHLFRTEYRKIISVLCKLFGIEHIEIAEDIVSDTFLLASETWGLKGLPKNPAAWLYTVSKNKTKDFLKHNAVFQKKIYLNIKQAATSYEKIEIDLSAKNINDSQLQMMFAICHPSISKEATYKRLARAKEQLRMEKVI
jgi:predicted RNA polymerase sigma factor